MYFLFIANKEEAKVEVIAREVSKKQQDCEEDLVKAEPALVAAQDALNTLNKVYEFYISIFFYYYFL
jgi:dynein heavy chain